MERAEEKNVRSCLEAVDYQTACDWLPKRLAPPVLCELRQAEVFRKRIQR